MSLSQWLMNEDTRLHGQDELGTCHALLDDMGPDRKNPRLRNCPTAERMELRDRAAGETQRGRNALAIITEHGEIWGSSDSCRPPGRDILRTGSMRGGRMDRSWYGLGQRGLPGFDVPLFAPTNQEFFAWAMWGSIINGWQAGSPLTCSRKR